MRSSRTSNPGRILSGPRRSAWVGPPERHPPTTPQFIARSRLILRGGTLAKGHWSTKLHPRLSASEIHEVLLKAATAQNGNAPVAARFQTNPDRVAALAPHSIASSVARHGILYKFASRPHLIRYPPTLRLNKPQREAVLKEITRLESIGAIERAPEHDGHKAILTSDPAWEKTPIPPGPWPRAQPVPVLSRRQRSEYDARLRRDWIMRKNHGLPPRDFENRVFTVPKSDGGFRLCTDCRALNVFQRKAKFQLDGVKTIQHLIQPGDYGALIDIKDCFIEFGLHPSQRRFVRFRDPRLRRWQWRTMNFGMSEAPHLCTKLLRPFIRILKGLGIRCSIYIDDMLVLSQSPHTLAVSMGVAMEMLQLELGLQLKLSKCNLAPSQTFQALGIIWDTAEMKCYVPKKRIKNIKSSSSRILNNSGAGKTGSYDVGALGTVRTRDLARTVGQIISTSVAMRSARRRLLHIHQLLGRSVRRKGWNGEIKLTPEAVDALRWWTTDMPFRENGNDIVPPYRPIHGTVTSDACTSLAGWGGTLVIAGKKYTTRGFFTSEERSQWINNLELLGHRKTVEALLPLAVPVQRWHQVHLESFLDNVSAIKYCKVGVSRSLQLSLLGADYWDWREEHRLSVSFNFLAGVNNEESDALSRVQMSHREWQLRPSFSPDMSPISDPGSPGPVRQRSQRSGAPVLQLRARRRVSGNERLRSSVGSGWDGVCLSPSHLGGPCFAEVKTGTGTGSSDASTCLDGTELVAHSSRDDATTPSSPAQLTLVNPRPVGSPDVAVPVERDRRTFIRRFAAREGVSAAVLEKGWSSHKSGYISKYDPHFRRFADWWETRPRSGRFSPRSIRPGDLADFLKHELDRGQRHASLKDASSSISRAVAQASSDAVALGSHTCVTQFLKAVRQQEAPSTRSTPRETTGDVVLLLEEAFLYGPAEALCLGHLKEKILLVLIVDTAARPSDIHRLYRILDGRHRQITFFEENGKSGMRIRYFWSKEVDPYSSRSNSTNTWFSKWVTVWCTSPRSICSHCLMRVFLDRSSDPSTFASIYVKELGIHAQPLAWALPRRGQLQPASKDHIANVIKAGLERAGLSGMTARDVRGASTSKIVQCAPQFRDEALNLGRWTTPKTFTNHYEVPVNRSPSLNDENPSSCQQILRWGFNPSLPNDMTLEMYSQPPQYWIGRSGRAGTVVRFDDGTYFVKDGRTTSSFKHWELMAAM